jgi:branched-subunit amino acid transport protein
MQNNVYIYILIMAGVSFLIRVLPLTLIRKPIKNQFIKSFLYYVPYVTLSVMTFPAILPWRRAAPFPAWTR